MDCNYIRFTKVSSSFETQQYSSVYATREKEINIVDIQSSWDIGVKIMIDLNMIL